MNLENKRFKSAAEIAAEGKTELESNLDEKTPDNNISSEEIKTNEIYDEKIEKQRVEDLKNLRGSMDLEQNPQDTNAEHPKTVADILAENKALVIEPDEIEDTPEFRERIKKITEARKLKEAENNTEQEKGIENTTGFQEAIASGDTAKAEAWLESVKDGKYKGNERWLDHRSGDLFRAYRDSGDFEGAQRMIDILPDEPTNENENNTPKKGRTKSLNNVMGSTESIDPLAAEKQAMREAIAEEEAMPDIPETEARKKEVDDLWGDVFEKVEKEKKEAEALDDSDFIEAFDNNDFVTAGKWLFANKTKINHSGGQEFLDRASGKLFEELLKSGNLDLAASMISINDNDKARQDMRLKLKQTK